MNIFLLFLLLVFQSVQLFGGYRHSLVMGDGAYAPYCAPSSSNFSISFSGSSLQASARARQEVNRVKQNFAAYVTSMRYQPGYEAFILDLYKKIQSDTDFRYSLEYVPGFNGRAGFLNYIGDENKRIEKEQVDRAACYKAELERQKKEEAYRKRETELKKQRDEQAKRDEYKQYKLKLDTAELTALIKKYKESKSLPPGYFADYDKIACRYQERINALEKANGRWAREYNYTYDVRKHPVFDDPYAGVFKHCYGTYLDKLLHQELCDIRTQVLELSAQYPDNFYVRVTVPAVNYYTALAKVQKSPTAAFNLADFADGLVRVIGKGIAFSLHTVSVVSKGVIKAAKGIDKANRAIESGIARAVKTTLDPQHWKDIIVGTLRFGLDVAIDIAKVDEREQISWAAAVTGKTERWDAQVLEYQKEGEVSRKEFDERMQLLHESIKKMSWDELLEKGVEIGAILVLDAVALRVVGNVASAAGRQFVSKTADIFNSGVVNSEAYLAEVAGVGKIALEEGPEVATEIVKLVEAHPEVLQQNGTPFRSHLQEMMVKSQPWGTCDDLIKSALAPDKGSTTKIGRAFQKHSKREITAFKGEITGHSIRNTQQGMGYLKKILDNPDIAFVVKESDVYGEILDVVLPDGMGARWSSNGKKFIGVLEPRRLKGI